MVLAMKYLVVIEATETGYSAYSPDLPGCVSTAETREAAEQSMAEAIAFHLEGLAMEGLEVPQPSTTSAYIEVAA